MALPFYRQIRAEPNFPVYFRCSHHRRGKFRSGSAEPPECAQILLRNLKCNADCLNPRRPGFFPPFRSLRHAFSFPINSSIFFRPHSSAAARRMYGSPSEGISELVRWMYSGALSPQLYIFQAASGNSLHVANYRRTKK